MLPIIGMADLFAFTLTGDDVSERKPSPEPYLLAADRFGLPPGEVVVFEDSAVGVASAVAAGTFCVAVNADVHNRPELHAAQLLMTSLTDFGQSEISRLFAGGPVGD